VECDDPRLLQQWVGPWEEQIEMTPAIEKVLRQLRGTPCIFCAMVAGNVPRHTVYEDEHLLAFLDHRPLNPGHVLVVPKHHEPDFHRLASVLYGALMQFAQRLGKCLAHLYQPPKVGLFVIGFHVPHVHVHVVPLYAMTDMTADAFARAQRTSPAAAVLADSAAQIRQALAAMEDNDTPT
jgi:histidine triad (HIT) family protein